ncbi:hypothetical protein [Acinetobacter sp.]
MPTMVCVSCQNANPESKCIDSAVIAPAAVGKSMGGTLAQV